MTTESSSCPLSGLWQPHQQLQCLYYGPSCVQKHLLSTLPLQSSKVFIITGNSIATKTPLLHHLEILLGSHYAGTFSSIKQHNPVAEIGQATEIVVSDSSIDTILSLGGGSPIDAAKAISLRVHEKSGVFLTHLTIPTTLGAAECTASGDYTNADGVKTRLGETRLGVTAIFYDPEYAKYTPKRLWLATGMRVMDHAVESMYQPYAAEMPWKVLSIWVVATLFEYLPKSNEFHPNDLDVITRLLLAANASLGFRGRNYKGMGLSHSIGHALGSPYGIPNGETSCLTLGTVVKFKAQDNREDAIQIARLLPSTGGTPSGDVLKDAFEVGDKIIMLVDALGLSQSLTERGVGKDQIPLIVERATGGMKEGRMYDAVKLLVEGLF